MSITFGWKSHVRDGDKRVRKETELTLDERDAERLMHKLATGKLHNKSAKAIQEDLKERAERVEVEKVYYDQSV